MQTAPPRLSVIAATALLCGVSIGYFAARMISPTGDRMDSAESPRSESRGRGADENLAAKPIHPSMAEILAGKKTPAERIALILRQPSGRFRTRQIELLAETMAATVHALKLDASFRRSALDATVGEWIAQDPAGAVTWARGLSPGVDRDGAVSAVVRALSRRDPGAA